MLSYFEQIYTVIQAVHSLLYIVAKSHFFSVVTWKYIIKYLQKCEGCTHFCEILYINLNIYTCNFLNIYMYVCAFLYTHTYYVNSFILKAFNRCDSTSKIINHNTCACFVPWRPCWAARWSDCSRDGPEAAVGWCRWVRLQLWTQQTPNKHLQTVFNIRKHCQIMSFFSNF